MSTPTADPPEALFGRLPSEPEPEPPTELEVWAEAMKTWAETATLEEAMRYSRELFSRVLAATQSTHEVVGIVALLSGGNDSTTFMHAFRHDITHVGHVNTGIGVKETREHVRRVCALWDLPLLEVHPPPGATYRELVLRFGFPGPAGHGLMFTRLKERGFRALRRQFVTNGRKQRVLYLAGMRHFESERRMRNTQETHTEDSMVWVSPFAWWTDRHLAEYRALHQVPRNEVSDHLHMSGECLCGAYAKPNELPQLRFFYPDAASQIDSLQVDAKAARKHCQWGTRPPKKPKGASGPTWLCFCPGSPHGFPAAQDAEACPDGTWWSPAQEEAPVEEVGPLCAKCEVFYAPALLDEARS